MKEFLGRILEPGETLVWRGPAPRRSWILPFLYPLAFALLSVLSGPLGLKPRDPDYFWIQFEIMAVLFWPLAAIFVVADRWKAVVTDRRVMQRKGFLRSGYEEMPRDAIEDVKNDIPIVILRGGGREMRIDAGGEALRLYAVLTGAVETVTAVELAPGETVVLRLPGRWRPWRIMVTDRRVVYRPPGHPPKTRQMQLDEIDDVRRDTVFRAILLRGAGQELAIRIGAGDTARLLETLNRPPWDALPLRERE